MMNYLNTNSAIVKFNETIHDSIYVDKSILIEAISININKPMTKYICITRPRRFGKTINANMLAAYYTKGFDSHELFDHLEIAKQSSYEEFINKYNVFYMDLSSRPDFCNSYHDFKEDIYLNIVEDICEAYGLDRKKYRKLSSLIKATNEKFIFILDEWDSIFYEDFMSEENKKDYLKFLKGFLKDQDYVDLAYMTGVLPIAKYSSGSELNMFKECNFMNDKHFDDFFGYSEDEVKALCQRFRKPTYEELQYWYNGYYRSDGKKLFNPRSVNYALLDEDCGNYWTETGPMNEIASYIEHNVDAVREDIVNMVAGNSVSIKLKGYSAMSLQLNTRDEILSAMVVFGFLSYHKGQLSIPNHELMEKFNDVLSRDSMGEVKKIVDQSKEMLEATINMDEAKVVEILESVHDQEILFLEYNNENSLSCVISLCYLYARDYYEISREEKSGKGYVDYIFKPLMNGPAIVLELKYNKSSKEAIEQIKAKNYIQKAEKYNDILIVGINYDEKKHHECIIEKVK